MDKRVIMNVLSSMTMSARSRKNLVNTLNKIDEQKKSESKEIRLYSEGYVELSLFNNLYDELIKNDINLYINDEFVNITYNGDKVILNFNFKKSLGKASNDDIDYTPEELWKIIFNYEIIITADNIVFSPNTSWYIELGSASSVSMYGASGYIISNNINSNGDISTEGFVIGRVNLFIEITTYSAQGYINFNGIGLIFYAFNAEFDLENGVTPGQSINNIVYIDKNVAQDYIMNKNWEGYPVLFGDGTNVLTDLGIFTKYVDLYLSQDNNRNKQYIEKLSSNNSYAARLDINNNAILGTYYNNTFTGFANGNIVIYNIDNNGNIALNKSIDLLTLADKIASL